MNEPWNVDVKAEAITALQEAYDDLTDALDSATEMDDGLVENQIDRARETINDLVTFLEVRR